MALNHLPAFRGVVVKSLFSLSGGTVKYEGVSKSFEPQAFSPFR